MSHIGRSSSAAHGGARPSPYTGRVHDVVDPYHPQKMPDELELSLRRLDVEMERRIYAERHPQFVAARARDEGKRPATKIDDAATDASAGMVSDLIDIIKAQEVKSPALAAKQSRLLELLKHQKV